MNEPAVAETYGGTSQDGLAMRFLAIRLAGRSCALRLSELSGLFRGKRQIGGMGASDVRSLPSSEMRGSAHELLSTRDFTGRIIHMPTLLDTLDGAESGKS